MAVTTPNMSRYTHDPSLSYEELEKKCESYQKLLEKEREKNKQLKSELKLLSQKLECWENIKMREEMEAQSESIQVHGNDALASKLRILEEQVTYLQQENQQLQVQLDEASIKINEASIKINDLEKRITNLESDEKYIWIAQLINTVQARMCRLVTQQELGEAEGVAYWGDFLETADEHFKSEYEAQMRLLLDPNGSMNDGELKKKSQTLWGICKELKIIRNKVSHPTKVSSEDLKEAILTIPFGSTSDKDYLLKIFDYNESVRKGESVLL